MTTSPLQSPDIFSALRTSLADASITAPFWLALTTSLHLLLALLPAVQIILMENTLSAVGSGEAAVPPMLALAAVLGISFPMGQVALAASQRLSLRMRLKYQMEALGFAASLEPEQLARADTTARAQSAYEAAQDVGSIPGGATRMLTAAITATTLGTVIGTLDPLAGGLIAVSLAPTLWAFTRIAAREATTWPAIGAAARRAQYTEELLLHHRTGTELAALGTSQKVLEKAFHHRRTHHDILDSLIGWAMRWEILAGAITAALLGCALVILVGKEMSAPSLAAAVTGTISGLFAVRGVGYATGEVIRALPALRLVHACRNRAETPVPATLCAPVASLVATGITVRYDDTHRPAVEGARIEAHRGEIVAIVGANGAGKSSLVQALIGAVSSRGTVLLDGLDVSGQPFPVRRRAVSLLVQEFGRYEFSVRDSVALGRPGDVDDEDIWAALEAAHLREAIQHLPRGLDTQLGQQWGGNGLSGGQWQRMALARIHLRDAPIWILDEPTSAVDAETEEALFAELRATRSRRITIVVTHRAWTLRTMDRIFVMDAGRVVQAGTFEELTASPGRFTELFTYQIHEGS